MLESDKNEKLLAVVFIGIDRFKNINETLGHSVGDDLLIQIADRLSVIEDSFLARYSGDVFAMSISKMNTIDKAIFATSQIRELLSQPFSTMGNELYITVSIGVSVYPLCYGGKDQLLSHAESAMYYSKDSGGNRVSCFDQKMTIKGKRRLYIETDLRKAIDNDQFEIYYQPQVSVQNRRLIGMEALIRWNHPEHGLILPEEFIPVAEETGLILPIGRWVLEKATQQVSEWINKGHGLLRVGVNLSPLQFEDKNLVKEIHNALTSTGLPPCALDIELTESAAMRDIKQTIDILSQFREMGIQTSMDDFGTGYSSLSYLKMMPLHTLKIDRAFIKDISQTGKNGELAEMIISMCHTLGLNVIAEGVETEEHMQFLVNHECIEAQGYLFSPPMPASDFEKILEEYNTTSEAYESTNSELLIFS